MLPERKEYPRPQFAREQWLSLNGEWEFCFDDADDGVRRGLASGKTPLAMSVNVPFTYEYPASGIGDPTPHAVVWYRRTFELARLAGRRALLCFNGCDYDTDVWVNGQHAASHRGAFAPFSADVTDFLKAGKNVVVVRCRDALDPAVPRGKQSWTGERFSCWYIPNTGIWQSVWLEFFGADCIVRRSLTPDPKTCSFSGEIVTMYGGADEAEIAVTYRDREVKRVRFSLDGKFTPYTVRMLEGDFVDESHYWTPEHPNLFYVEYTLYAAGKVADRVRTRFGMRKVSLQDGHILLNDRPCYQRLILDQGYWKESGLTPPSAEALKKDIELAKAMGFNGARKHQKFEDPYFYYYAEELGFLTWCEMPSAYCFCAEEVAAVTAQWQEIVAQAQNFTSVVCYVPLNESWGVRKILNDARQQDFARSLYRLTKALDPSRPVSTNDGWENSDETDIISIHDYAKFGDDFAQRYRPEYYDTMFPNGGRRLMQEGCVRRGQSVMFTEFGGIAMKKDAGGGNWGYNDAARDEDEFLARYASLMRGIAQCDFDGFCYTQLTDVQQEVNGLLDEDHVPKFDIEAVRELTAGKKN
mgnify:FL=1